MERQPILSDRDMSVFELKTRFVRNYLTFAGKSSKDFLLYISGPGVYDAPEVDLELTSVPGKNGDLVRENAKTGQRRFKNLDITYHAFFFDVLPARSTAVKSWLLSPSGYQVLHDTYDPDFFRMGICKDAISLDVKRQKAASMELTFHCQPQRWSIEGQRKVRMEKPGTIRNPYAFASKPIIRVYGSGPAKLYVGSEMVTIYSIDGYVDLNCETHNAYHASGFCNDTIKSDDFPDFEPGKNHISWTGGIEYLEITPRWWTL
jgi:phage-related protein